jgi:hypothetical protein
MTTDKKLIPIKAIIIYQDNKNGSNYLESGDFVNRNEQYDLEGLKPFTMSQLMKISTITEEKKGLHIKGLIPKNLILFKQSNFIPSIAWHVKSSKRKILFAEKKLTKEYLIPDMVFHTVGKELSVFLITKKCSKKIVEETILYKTHFLNVYDDCKVCVGNGYRLGNESISVDEYMNKVEFNFFEGSLFTGAHRSDVSLNKIWNEENGIYLESEWKKSEKTISSLL